MPETITDFTCMIRKNFLVSVVWLLALHSNAQPGPDTSIISQHLYKITQTEKFRNYKNVDQLNKTADYIRSVFLQYADSVYVQEYSVDGVAYKNIIACYGLQHTKRVIVGAHYDVCEDQQGADDNASGTVGLLELARLLKGKTLQHRVDLVAYTLEEPPYFRTENMGSYIHAKSMAEEKADIYGMVSLEMIGYFSDKKKSQSYPIGLLSLFYGNRGNYITLVKKFGAGRFARKFAKKYKAQHSIRTKKFTAPSALPGIDFSDHMNYWKFGYSALMITNTAFYRNKNYHQHTDMLETLDIPRMAKVIDGVYKTLTKL